MQLKLGWTETTNEEYHLSEGLSSSQLKFKTLAHYYASLENKKEQTPQMRLGTNVHAHILEGKKFEILPSFDKRTIKGREEYNAFMGENPDSNFVSEEELRIIEGIAKSINQHRVAGNLFQDGIAELSGYAIDQETGLTLKIRPDYRRNDGIIIDLKTTVDASPEYFKHQSKKLGYHLSAAYYLDVANLIEGENSYQNFIIVACETYPPYAVCCYLISNDVLSQGRKWYRSSIEAINSGKTTGYSDDLETLDFG